MATACSSSLILAFPLLIILIAFPISTLATAPEEVRDIKGKKLLSGIDYYILPAVQDAEGNGMIALAGSRKGTCPLDVIQQDYNFYYGVPLKFFPVNPKMKTVSVSTDLNIKFNTEDRSCNASMVWKLTAFDREVKQYFVGTDGSVGNPGRETLSNWFKIEKYEEHYKLSYCPSVCKYCKVICKDLGLLWIRGILDIWL
ncbi:hypothetical protein Sjap_011665 [Stephania japonica]|uniref:Miraculin n=1 Tax=Stephania japonica TaxID=461633 RepID=A0AAP0JDV5_9MAGN